MTTLDFFTGFALMNAMPHLLAGLFGVRFLSMFGFSSAGNIAYAGVNVAVAMVLFHLEHGIGRLLDNGVVVGALAMLVIYAATGRFLFQLFQRSPAPRG